MKTIHLWNDKDFTVGEQDHFYAIFLEDKFLAASTIKFDKENSQILISIINGSISSQYCDSVQQESDMQLRKIAYDQYGQDYPIVVNTINRFQKKK